MTRRLDIPETSFGLFDGCTSVLGIMLAVGATHASALILAAVGLAVSSSIGMAGGEYLSDNGRGITAALTIGVATGVGTLAPVVPFFALSGTAALVVGCIVIAAAGALISGIRTRERHDGVVAWVPWCQTFAILALAAGASAGAAAVLGGAG